jgi:hypothetical protein
MSTWSDDAFSVAMQILRTVRLRAPTVAQANAMEREWHDQVVDRCHVWGEFYGPATSPHLARAIAHRYLDRQGGDLDHLRDALAKYGKPYA